MQVRKILGVLKQATPVTNQPQRLLVSTVERYLQGLINVSLLLENLYLEFPNLAQQEGLVLLEENDKDFLKLLGTFAWPIDPLKMKRKLKPTAIIRQLFKISKLKREILSKD
ncbi:MAG: hypothetical protein ABIH69_06980 [bacterium]|nr:hypothetical protein [Candidatus Margulisiibacteriota bacterium]